SFVFYLFTLITVVRAEEFILENEAEDIAPAVHGESGRECIGHRRSCKEDRNGCCRLYTCNCWYPTPGDQWCKCQLW
nr:RecName: Full=U10-ctenitoxin-Pn1a; Short=U10-CNTX-Pn1a; AltName: Full=Neurotoxin Pn3-5A; Flags: Precursor [Phoneutria nigriventer]